MYERTAPYLIQNTIQNTDFSLQNLAWQCPGLYEIHVKGTYPDQKWSEMGKIV